MVDFIKAFGITILIAAMFCAGFHFGSQKAGPSTFDPNQITLETLITRKDAQRMQNNQAKAAKMWDTAEYWVRRAAGAIADAKYKELPAVRARRIKKLKASKRKYEKEIKELERIRDAYHCKFLTCHNALKEIEAHNEPKFRDFAVWTKQFAKTTLRLVSATPDPTEGK